MKKFSAIVLLGFLLLGFIGCGGGGVATTASPGHSLVTMNLGMIKAASRAGALLKTETGIPPDVTTIRITISAPDLIPPIIKIIDLAGISSLSITIEVPNGRDRHFLVEALDASGRVLYSGVIDTDLDGTPVSLSVLLASTDPLPPDFAGIIRVQDPTLNSLTLAWSPASDNVTAADKIQYLVYMSTSTNGEDMGNPTITTEKGLVPFGGVVLFVVNNLQPATTYYFKVRAMDERGNVDSNTVEKSGTTLSSDVNPPPPPPPDQQFVDFTPFNDRIRTRAGNDALISELIFSVVNNGNIPAFNVKTWVLYDFGARKASLEALAQPSAYCRSFTAHSLYPGNAVQFTFSFFSYDNYLIIVDPENTFAESNESNNTACGGTFCNNPPNIPRECNAPIN